METTTLQVEVRTECGKGPSRRLRAAGKLPGVFYGSGVSSTPLILSPNQVERALQSERGRNVVFKFCLSGDDQLAMVKDLTVDPVTQELLHVDLYRVFEDQELDLMVPFHANGRAIGVVQGGVLNVTRRKIPLRGKPERIPVSVGVDVTELDLKQTLSVKDLTLPEGVVCTLSPDLTLVIILEARRAALDEDEEAQEPDNASLDAGTEADS